MALLSMRNLTKTFKQGNGAVAAVNDVSFDVEPGEKVSLTGPSGCGKTTLLNLLGFIITPTSGGYFIEGRQTVGFSEKDRAVYRNSFFGFVAQDFALIEEESVYKNIELPLLYAKPGIPREQRKAKIDAVIEATGLLVPLREKAKNLSGGQRQRVAVARAIVNDPKIILADEPTGALDSKNGEKIMDLLGRLVGQGKTLLLVTHDPTIALACDRQLRMRDGVLWDP